MKQSRCFSGIPLLILWYNTCWQFDLWFPVFSKSSLYIWTFLVHILLMPNLKDFEYHLASMWNENGCIVIWTFFGIAFLWDWSETDLSCGHCWVFQIWIWFMLYLLLESIVFHSQSISEQCLKEELPLSSVYPAIQNTGQSKKIIEKTGESWDTSTLMLTSFRHLLL